MLLAKYIIEREILAPMGVVGWTKNSFPHRVYGIVFDIGLDEPPTHMGIMGSGRMNNEDWRWRYKDGLVYWWEPAPMDVKKATKAWLESRDLPIKAGTSLAQNRPIYSWSSEL